MKQLIFITGFIITGLFGVSGCTSWPAEGKGGMAEHHQQMFNSIMPDQPLGPEHGLRFELDLGRRHLDVLILEGAELCFPATVVQARRRQDRITRELFGGLDFDAANDLIVQRKLLERLERQLDYVKQQGVCTLPITQGQKTPADLSQRIYDLLNVDNQFAFDSAELNPKYVGRLAEAALLLRDQPGYNLRITGHADATGEKEYNLKLSLERAKMVGRYLQVLGLTPGRIQFDAVGSESPLFDNQEAHYRLVNRRVSIELIEVPGSSLTTQTTQE